MALKILRILLRHFFENFCNLFKMDPNFSRISVSLSTINSINSSKKRNMNVGLWNRVASKLERNSGQAYISVSGEDQAPKDQPLVV
jgi:hypothetical protein